MACIQWGEGGRGLASQVIRANSLEFSNCNATAEMYLQHMLHFGTRAHSSMLQACCMLHGCAGINVASLLMDFAMLRTAAREARRAVRQNTGPYFV